MSRIVRFGAAGLGIALLVLFLLPVAGLVGATRPDTLFAGLTSPETLAAAWLSARTTTAALAIIVAMGTPLAWWLSRRRTRWHRALELAVELPVVLPPAVVGVALLLTFGRQGVLGGPLAIVGLSLPFSTAAVVLAQVIVAGPFYVQAAANAFHAIDDDTLLVARTLGAPPAWAFATVALPTALPGLLAGAALAWARALGEFGATLLFAGNLPGTTQTLPLAIYTALEQDVGRAAAIAVVLLILATAALGALSLLPTPRSHR